MADKQTVEDIACYEPCCSNDNYSQEKAINQLLIKERLDEVYRADNHTNLIRYPEGIRNHLKKRIANLENQLGEKS